MSFKCFFLLVFYLFSFVAPVVEGVAPLSVDKIILEKHKRTLCLMSGNKVLKTYKVALGFEPKGPKKCEGDGKTPEGIYTIDWRQHSKNFHKSLHISYPSKNDKQQTRDGGESPGGAIMLHGLGKFDFLGSLHTAKDWTLGCVAVTNEEIDEIWDLVSNGTTIEIRP